MLVLMRDWLAPALSLRLVIISDIYKGFTPLGALGSIPTSSLRLLLFILFVCSFNCLNSFYNFSSKSFNLSVAYLIGNMFLSFLCTVVFKFSIILSMPSNRKCKI